MMPQRVCLREAGSAEANIALFPLIFIGKHNFAKAEMIKGKYDYFQKGKGLLKCAAIGSSKHFVNIGFNH